MQRFDQGLALQRPPLRAVFHAEALAWLASHPATPGMSVITSLPDLSEVPAMGLEGWKAWFKEAAKSVLAWIPHDGTCIFYQSDIRLQGAWVSKGFWVQEAAAALGYTPLWHKIVCRKLPGTITPGRASYGHMICLARDLRQAPLRPGPDVLVDAGPTNWRRGMGEYACREACRFLYQETVTTTVVDPFCGQGAILAMANLMGFAAIGVELNRKRCERAMDFHY